MTNMVLRTTVIAWLCVQAVYCQATKNSCRVDGTEEGCAKRVICDLKEEVVREKREITISLRADSGDETIADCSWVRSGEFDCDPATGYTCDPQLSVTFSVNITKPEKCIKSGEFLFEVAHEKSFSCQIGRPAVQVIPEEKINSDNASANENPERPNKCRNSTHENENASNRTKRSTSESEIQCQEGASDQETHTGMIIGVVCLLVCIGVLLLVAKRKTLVTFVRKRKRHEGTCVEAPDYKTAVKDFEKRKCLMPETEDSPIADTMEEKDVVLEALHLRPGINYEVNTNIIKTNPTEYDKVCDVRLAHYASSCDGDDRYCGSSSEQT